MSAPSTAPPSATAESEAALKKQRWRSFWLTLAAPVAAFVFALVVVAIVVLASGRSLGDVFGSIGSTMEQGRNVVDVLNRTTLYYIAALSVAVGFKMNLFNIGVEGQYRLAALVAAWVGASLNGLPGPLQIICTLLAAMLTGAIWAGIAGILKVTRGVSEVISTIMLNAISAAMIGFLLRDGGFSPDPAGRRPATEAIDQGGWFPDLNFIVDPVLDLLGFKKPPASSNTYGFLLVAVVLGVLYAVMLNRTRFGFDLRASGSNQSAAQASGVSAKRMAVYAMLLSGALAGLIGMGELLGGRQHAFTENFISGIGFTGISVALLGRNNPVGMFFASMLWAFLDISTRGFQIIGISNKLSSIMQAVVLIAVVIAYTVVSRRTKVAEARSVAAQTPGAVAASHEPGESPESAERAEPVEPRDDSPDIGEPGDDPRSTNDSDEGGAR